MITFNNSCDGAYSSLDVRFTKHCDNRCVFCIEKTGIKARIQNINKMVSETLESGIQDVLILGGEPFLFPTEMLEYISRIRNGVEKIRATTSLPFNTVTPIIDNIFNLLDNVNVSIQSIDWISNNRILRTYSNHNRLETLRLLSEKYSDKIRVSLNLVRGGIDSKEKLEKSIDYLCDIGVKHFKVNELQESPDQYVSYENIMGVKLPSPYSYGCSTYHNGVLVKRSCFLVEPSAPMYFSDLFKLFYKNFRRTNNKFCVLYEDGVVEKGWAKDEGSKRS